MVVTNLSSRLLPTIVASITLLAMSACRDGGLTADSASNATEPEVLAHTGTLATGGEAGFGEVIRLDAPDFPAVAAQLAAGFPLPPGIRIDDVLAPLRADEPTDQAVLGVRASIEFLIGCEWATYWLESHSAADSAAMADAQAVLDLVPSWPATVATDGGGVVVMWSEIGNAARAMDPVALNDAGYGVNCTDVIPGR